MITYEEAIAIITSSAEAHATISLREESIPLEQAPGRILASDIVADRDYPPFNRSAMDGFAFNFSDWQEGVRNFTIAEVIFAGQVATKQLKKAACYKIMTGAAVPESANCVVRREDTLENGDMINILSDEMRIFQNIARRGEDTRKGEVIIKAPALCSPSVISALATTGHAVVRVKKIPEVAVFTTGDEVVKVGDPVSPVQIRNSNQHLLRSLLQKWGILPAIIQHLPDDKEIIRESLSTGIQQDIVILSGGVSAGDADFVPEILQELGVEKLFYKVAIRPGKPIWCGRLPQGGMVFALPGNPFSCLVTFKLFVESYLHQMLFKKKRSNFKFLINTPRYKKHKLTEFFPVQISTFPEKGIRPIPFNGSGDIRAGLFADGLAIQPAETNQLNEGDFIEFMPLG